MKTFLLDFSNISSEADLWDEVNKKIGFGGFGRNLDAFEDILSGGFGHFENLKRSKFKSLELRQQHRSIRNGISSYQFCTTPLM